MFKYNSQYAELDEFCLANVLWFSILRDSWPKISSNRSLEDFYHESKQGPCQGSVPSPFRMLVTNESMLCLNFQKLRKRKGQVS